MTARDRASTTDLSDPSLCIDREIAWLAFNERVLDQAHDPRWPLLERVKSLAIFASNLDEFFMIRVAGLAQSLESEAQNSPESDTVERQLSALRQAVPRLTDRAGALYQNQLVPELEKSGVALRNYQDLSDDQRQRARGYFESQAFPVLTPLAVDPIHPFPFISNLSISLAVEVENPETLESRFARVKVPESLPRFVDVNSGLTNGVEAGPCFVPLEQLIQAHLDELFPGMRIAGSWPIRVTRDMDLELLEEEADDLLAEVDREIRRRRFGDAVRLEIPPDLPVRIRDLLLDKLGLKLHDAYVTRGLIGLSGLFRIAGLPRSDLRDPPLKQQVPSTWSAAADPFSAIAAQDILLHHPYDSFTPVLDFLHSAALDPNVLAIKMTLYRAGSNAEALRTLVTAAEKGKQVAISIELQARFDEENNISWARTLERAGVHVFYGARDRKTHAKVLMVVRREGGQMRRYVHLSTGNYNASTARLYTDLALFTADPAIGEDVTQLFNDLSGFARDTRYERILVGPQSLRSSLLAKIREQAERALAGRRANIFAKLNSLVDRELVLELYRASQAGVNVDLVVRGICCLRPGLPGISERIRVRSLIGRFLEHERIYWFGPPGEDEVYLGSADLMPRNLDRRVELLFPVLCEPLRQRIRRECLEPLEHDNCQIYEMASDGSYSRRRPGEGEALRDAQRLSELAAQSVA
jgi:polyphosphate kinase